MKNLFILIALLVLSVGWLSSCSTLFDVSPKAIYSPINLTTSTATYTQDAVTVVTGTNTTTTGSTTVVTPITTTVAVGYTTLKFSVKEPSLKYAAVVFYDRDSSEAALLVKTSNLNLVAHYELYAEGSDSKGTDRTVKIKTNPSRGQYQCIVPIGYNRQDSTKIFCAQGYARTRISPWSYVTDINEGITLDSIRLVQSYDGKRLSYLLFNKAQFTAYTYAASNRSWSKSNSITLNKSASFYPSYNLASAYFIDNQYHVFVKKQITERLTNGIVGEFGAFKTDANLTAASYITITDDIMPPDAFLTNFSDKAATLVFTKLRPRLTTCLVCVDANLPNVSAYKYPFSSPASSLTISLPPDMVSQEPFTQQDLLSGGSRGKIFPTTVYKPTIAAMIGDKLIINRKKDPSYFRTYQALATSTSITEVSKNLAFSYQLEVNIEPILTMSQGTESWVLDRKQQLYKVTLTADNQPVLTKKYSIWFPAGNFNENAQGVIYEGKFYFLINKNELWSFDPNQIDIDFSRPGAYTIVPL